MTATVLPQRRFRIGHRPILVLIAALLVIGLFVTGIFEIGRWEPFLNLNIVLFLAEGLLGTLKIAVGALIASVVVGLPLGIARSGLRGPIAWVVGGYVELARATPILFVLIFLDSFQNRAGLGLGWLVVSIIALTVYNSAVLAEIVRSGMASIPTGEVEAARSLGLNYGATTRHVILPQALSRMAPAIVGQLITLIKDTSLAYVIGAQEIVRFSRNVYVQNANILETYFVVALVFFVICFTLSRISRRLEAGRPTDVQRLPTGHEA